MRESRGLKIRGVRPIGVPVASVQETTIRRLTVNIVEENAGLCPRIQWVKARDILDVYDEISPVNGIVFHRLCGGLRTHSSARNGSQKYQ
jgi:hypothetical protein